MALDKESMELIGNLANPVGRLSPQLAGIVGNSSLEQVTNGLDEAKKVAVSTEKKPVETGKGGNFFNKVAESVDKSIGTKTNPNPVTQNLDKTKANQPALPTEKLQQEIIADQDLEGFERQQKQALETNKQTIAKNVESMKPEEKKEYYKQRVNDSFVAANLALTGDEGLANDLLHTADWFNKGTPEEIAKNKALFDQRKLYIETLNNGMNRIKEDPNLTDEQKLAGYETIKTQADQYRAQFNENLKKAQSMGAANVPQALKEQILSTPSIKSGIIVGGEKKESTTPDKKIEKIVEGVQLKQDGTVPTTNDLKKTLERTTKAVKTMPDNTLRDVLELVAKTLRGVIGKDYTTSAEKEADITRELDKMNQAIAMEQQSKLDEATNEPLQAAIAKNLGRQQKAKEEASYPFDVGKIIAGRTPSIDGGVGGAGKTFAQGGK